MVSRCAAVMLAAAAVAEVALPVDLHALDGDASEMPECSVSLLQTRMEKMRKSQVSAETSEGVKANSQVDGAAQASEAMKEMGEAITNLFSLEKDQEDKPRGAEAIKKRAALQSTAIGKASHAIEDVKQAFSKLLAHEEVKAKAGKEKTEKKENKKADDVSFTQSQDTRIGHSSTFNLEAAADFWDDADVKASTDANKAVFGKEGQKQTEGSGSNVDIWDDDWKTASNAGSIDVTKSAAEGSYLSQSNYLQAALEEHHVEQKSDADDQTKPKVVLSWGTDEEPSQNSLLSAKTGGFPLTMAREKSKEEADDEDAISSKKFETSDEQVVEVFTGGSVAQNSKSIQSILGDMSLSPDDQGLFGLPQAHEEDEAVENKSSLATNNQSKSEMQNETVLAAKDQGKPNKTSLATVGSAIKSVIKSVENSSWPWSKHPKPAESSAEVLAKDASNSTKELNQDVSKADQSVEIKTSANGTDQLKSNTTKEDATKTSVNDTELAKSNKTATEESAGGAALESSNKTAQDDIANGTKSIKTSEAKSSTNDTSNSTDKK